MTPKKHPVVEVFGPTIQGEGVDQGASAHFVRFGGCDFACTWCDSPHAVVPSEVRANASRLTAEAIVDALAALMIDARWVVLTGGNPALQELEHLVTLLHKASYRVSVETQGTRWKAWLGQVDRLCISPKPPSAIMGDTIPALAEFMGSALTAASRRWDPSWMFLKIVVFDEVDLDYAELVHDLYPAVPMYLSTGNDAGRTVGQPERMDPRSIGDVRTDLIESCEHLVTEVQTRPKLMLGDVRVQTQQHVLLWGNELGR